jgi:hypothetical protein
MWDTRDPRLDEVPPGGTLNIVDRVGLRNSVRKADFDSLVLQSSIEDTCSVEMAHRFLPLFDHPDHAWPFNATRLAPFYL